MRCNFSLPARVRGSLGYDQRLIENTGTILRLSRDCVRIAKTGFTQDLFPVFHRQKRMRWPQIRVGKSPPSFGLTEHQVDPACRSESFEESQYPPRGEHPLHIRQRLAKVSGRVQKVSGYNHVELLWREPLRFGTVFNVKQRIPHGWKPPEFPASGVQEHL